MCARSGSTASTGIPSRSSGRGITHARRPAQTIRTRRRLGARHVRHHRIPRTGTARESARDPPPDDARLAAPRSRRRRVLSRRARRPRDPAIERHRSSDRAAADLERGRHRAGRAERRDLQLSCPSPRAPGAGPPLPDRVRRRGTRARVRNLWPECVARLDGMFAFAIWDAVRRTLVLARDRMGEKPLYYSAGADAFVFGSELRAVLEHPAVPRELSLESLVRYLAFEYVPAPHSILAGIAKLPPGHMLTISPGSKPDIIQYWDLPFNPDYSVSEHEWVERLRAQLEASVRQRIEA